MGVTVVIATFGASKWQELARSRALPSVPEGVPVILSHEDTLAKARNRGLGQVQTEWVVHLDADDELEPGYLEALALGSADLRAPSVRYVRPGREFPPAMPRVAGHRHACTGDCLPAGNWLVVGSMVRAELARSVGGWEEWPLYEDWALWLRCYMAGASVEAIPAAVYRAHVRTDSRNRGPGRDEKMAAHRQIAAACGAPVPA